MNKKMILNNYIRSSLAEDKKIIYVPTLDGLRAIAILGVVCFHLFPEYIPGGFVGVDIFFVVSGYIITKIIQ